MPSLSISSSIITGLFTPDAAQRLDDASGHRTDISAAMTAKLRFVAHAAERHPFEFTSERTCDRASERSLTDSRRSDEKKDRRFAVRPKFHDRQRFENAFFDVFEAVVVFVEDLAGFVKIELLFARFVPRQFENVFEICANDVIVGRRLRQLLPFASVRASASLRTSSGRSAFSSRSRSCSASAFSPVSSSPSSFWIAFICWRRT